MQFGFNPVERSGEPSNDHKKITQYLSSTFSCVPFQTLDTFLAGTADEKYSIFRTITLELSENAVVFCSYSSPNRK